MTEKRYLFAQSIQTFTKKTRYEKDALIQNVVNNGVLEDSMKDLYIPNLKFDKSTNQKIYVNMQNLNSVLQILDNYNALHPYFGIALDYENTHTYHIENHIIDYFAKLYNITLPTLDTSNIYASLKNNRRPYDEELRTRLNEVITRMVQDGINIDNYITTNYDYFALDEERIALYLRANELNIASIYFNHALPTITLDIVKELLKQKINILDKNWFKNWFGNLDVQNTVTNHLQQLDLATQITQLKISLGIGEDILKQFMQDNNINYSKLWNDLLFNNANYISDSRSFDLDKKRANDFIESYNELAMNKLQPFTTDTKHTNEQAKKLLDALFETNLDDRLNKMLRHHQKDNFQFFPVWTGTFSIEGYDFVFIENAVWNADVKNVLYQKANSWTAHNIFYQQLINNGVTIFTLNGGKYDKGVNMSILLYLDPYRFTHTFFAKSKRAIPFKNARMQGAVEDSVNFAGYNLNSYYADQKNAKNPCNEYASFILYSAQTVNPIINFKEEKHTDCLNESLPGATDENAGIGLKQFESNTGLSIEENKGFSFSALLPSEGNNENLTKFIQYNCEDTHATLDYAYYYKNKQQAAKNALINLSGQGANLFEIKDGDVAALLNQYDFFQELTYDKKETNPLYLNFLKPVIQAYKNHVFTLTELKPLGIEYYLSNLGLDNVVDNEKLLKENYTNAIIGLIYRLYYWNDYRMWNHLDAQYPEFMALNQANRYKTGFKFDSDISNYLSMTNNEKITKTTEFLRKNQTILTNSQDLVLQNESLITFIKNLKPALDEINSLNKDYPQIILTYLKYQQSDAAINAEQAKLKQIAYYESLSNAQLVKTAANKMIYLSKDNPSWDPRYKLNATSSYVNNRKVIDQANQDLLNPTYQRVKYLYEFVNQDEAVLKKITQTEEEKDLKDLNLDDCVMYHFDTIAKLDETIHDDRNILNAIKFHDFRNIYHKKPLKLLEQDRINAANYYNNKDKKQANFPSFQRVWYNEFMNQGLLVYKNNEAYWLDKTIILDPKNWEIRTRHEFAGDVLNQQYYPYLVFKYEDFEYELNGVSLDWIINSNTPTINDLVAPTNIESIEPYEVKYYGNSKDTWNEKEAVRYELGLKITVQGKEYSFRLDNVSPTKMNSQLASFYQIQDKFVNSQWFGIDESNNLDLDNSVHDFFWKKGNNIVYSNAKADWYKDHPQFPVSKKKAALNNQFHVLIENDNNQGVSFDKTNPWFNSFFGANNKDSLILNNIIRGGIHGARICWFNADSGLRTADPDQTSFYPAIIIAFIQDLRTICASWYKRGHNQNISFKRSGQKIKRAGAKLSDNSGSGFLGEVMSALADIALSTTMLATGQLQNLEMHAIITKLMKLFNVPFSMINTNTDGNSYAIPPEALLILEHKILDALFMAKFDRKALEEYYIEDSDMQLKDIVDFDKFEEFRRTKNSFYYLKTNTVENGGSMLSLRQIGVNQFHGCLTNHLPIEKDKSKNEKLYNFLETNQILDHTEKIGDDVRIKFFDYYKTNRDNLPFDFDYNWVVENVKIKGACMNWNTLMQLEEAKKHDKIVLTDQYARFGTFPIVEFAFIERDLFDQDLRKSLRRFDDLLYFARNAKKTANYDEAMFIDLNGNQLELGKNTRYIIAKTKDKSLIGNINKIKLYNSEVFDAVDLKEFLETNAAIKNNQNAIVNFARNLDNMTSAFNQPGNYFDFKAINGLDDIFYVEFNIDEFINVLKGWDNARKSEKKILKYQKLPNRKFENIPTSKNILKTMYKFLHKDFDEEMYATHFNDTNYWDSLKDDIKDTFSQILSYKEKSKDYVVTTANKSISKFTGSLVANDSIDNNGYYHGNYIINEAVKNFKVHEDTLELYKNDEPTGVFLDEDFYYHNALYTFWNWQSAYLVANNQPEVWLMTPTEVADLLTQNDVKPNWKGVKDLAIQYVKDAGINLDHLTNHYKVDDEEEYLAEDEELLNGVEETEETSFTQYKSKKKAKPDKKTLIREATTIKNKDGVKKIDDLTNVMLQIDEMLEVEQKKDR